MGTIAVARRARRRGVASTLGYHAEAAAACPRVCAEPTSSTTKRLLDEEGIFAGVSSGAIASIAVRIANELDEGNVVFIVCDDGWKYLSSGLHTTPVDELENLDTTVWW